MSQAEPIPRDSSWRPRAVHPRLAARIRDLTVVQNASLIIGDLGAGLERDLVGEQRPAERLRMLRETTNRITRTANDAVQAYSRARRAVTAELARRDGDTARAREMGVLLADARREMLSALQAASRRYAWAEPWAPREIKQSGDEATG